VPTVGTTAIQVITAVAADPVSFELHADADNSDTINYNAAGDTSVTVAWGELLPGQSITVTDFVGDLYIIAESGTLTWSLPFVQYRSVTGSALEVIKT
jgi:hypothetical protein